MASYIKIEASQSGPFSDNFNNIDFDIPDEDYDFSKSYKSHSNNNEEEREDDNCE
jgi:hypothetical protein